MNQTALPFSVLPIDSDKFHQGIKALVLSPIAWVCMIATGIVMAFLGPFGTFESLSLPLRSIFWQLICLGNALTSSLCLLWAVNLRSNYPSLGSVMLLVGIVSLANMLPGSIIVLLSRWVFLGLPMGLEGYVVIVIQVVLMTFLITSTFVTIRFLILSTPTPLGDPFDQRIPDTIKGELLAISAEDHYLHVYTAMGSALIKCSMKEALNELSAERGRQVHRSHWVAAHAVIDANRVDNQWQLTLSNGITIPVSRQHAQALKAAGWFNKIGHATRE